MTMTKYTLVVSEMDSSRGLSAEVRSEDGTIRTGRALDYADFGVEAIRNGDGPGPVREDFAADATRLDVQVRREEGLGEDVGAFTFSVVGDDETVATVRVTDSDWRLAAVAE